MDIGNEQILLEASDDERSRVFVWGNKTLLDRPAIGICGSRKASEHGLGYAFELGRLATKYGLVVVSGYAGGVDQRAHSGALESGGQTIAVLAEGLDRFNLRVSLRDWVTGSNFLALSEFPMSAGWTTWRAMRRNKTIISIADAMFVVEAGDSGGTLDAGKETLRQGKPLFVLDHRSERPTTLGNKLLIEQGAPRISNMRELKQALESVKLGEVVGARRLI